MSVGNVCKGTSIVLYIFDFIGSIVLGNEFGGRHFSWSIFLYGVILGFVFCLSLYALGEIIAQLEISNDNSYKIWQLLNKNNSQEENNTKTEKSYLSPFTTIDKKPADGGWVCKKCGTKNDSNIPFCKDCGEHINNYIYKY